MKAVYLDKKGGADSLISGEIQRPNPNDGQVLVKVHATAVMPSEAQWIPTFQTRAGGPRPFPIVLGHEFSGVIEGRSSNVSSFTLGEEVFGINDWFSNGAQAEYCVVDESGLAKKPESLHHTEAAVVPISALTAWQGLFEKANLQRGQDILIHGAAGSVGMFAVQMARLRGARVIATASSGNADFVQALGADQVIDYRKTPFEHMICEVDAVLDTVGGETLERSWKLLKPGGRMVTIATGSEQSRDPRVRDAFMIVRADGSQLAQIAWMIDAGELRVFPGPTFELARAREAYDRAAQGGIRGKVALRIIE
ncbi:MAG TPA: NADP-dependent oxidoreductase [Candidatus Sulfotelmatobacter sp.]|nr:NADP-dependent oxidoreductase [Candidatus Sulfotelmatobacter sp.]